MFNLGFTMEELMFPENYQSNLLINIESKYLIEKFGEITPTCNNQEQIIIDDDNWFTIKQLHSDTSSNDNNISPINDQILPLLNVFSDNCYLSQVKSMVELNDTITALLLPNLSIKVAHDKHNSSSSSDIVLTSSPSFSCDQLSLTTNTTSTQQQQSNKHLMSKSTSSLSFCTQSSTSMTSNSASEMSPNSNDLNELVFMHRNNESVQKLSHHYKNNNSGNDESPNVRSRRRRKRTIFSLADIEHLKEAFIQNPKPSQQDIAILSEQLGHDSYVIRVWFYNKRQATKKRTV